MALNMKGCAATFAPESVKHIDLRLPEGCKWGMFLDPIFPYKTS
jgi:hypothetical protein